MRKDYFIFDGLSSLAYGILLAGPATADAPQRDITTTQIPGRSGDLVFDNGRYLNQTLRYHAAILHGFEQRFAALKTALLLRGGYRRLEDTIHPEEYRLACFVGPIAPQTTPYNRAGEFDIEFNCKPQRFLKSGEHPIRLTVPGTALINRGLPSMPLITVYGSGEGRLSVAGANVTLLDSFTGPVMLDCDTQNAYWGAANKNNMITAPVFPTLPSGRCVIGWTGGIERVEIIPRWWTL